MKTLYHRLIDHTINSEWSQNFMDGRGNRCPWCEAEQNPGNHKTDCKLGILCNDIRICKQAKNIVEGK
jgi:hypothetical protein